MRMLQFVLVFLIAFAFLLLAGCGTFGNGAPHASRTLTYADFVVDPANPPAQSRRVEPSLDSAEAEKPSSEINSTSTGGDEDAAENAPPPTDEAPGGPDDDWTPEPVNLEPGDRIMIDSLIGEINGRPIYANEFFAPIDSLLRREREKSRSISAFEAILKEVIDGRLIQIVQSELLLAEALSQITPEQQVGLIAWLSQRREDIVARRGGFEAGAEEDLAAEGYSNLDEAVEDQRDRALLRMLLQKEVSPRVIVSWKDVERAYQRRYDEFNPPAKATLATIRLTVGRDDAKIATAEQQLQSGVPFLEVAEAVGMLRGGLLSEDPYVLGPGGLAEIEDLIPLYREKLTGLGPGDTVGPFSQDARGGREFRVWLHVVKIEREPGRPIYDPDVQMQLKAELLQDRYLIEQNRYFRTLLDDAIEADLDKLQWELERIGIDRYS